MLPDPVSEESYVYVYMNKPVQSQYQVSRSSTSKISQKLLKSSIWQWIWSHVLDKPLILVRHLTLFHLTVAWTMTIFYVFRSGKNSQGLVLPGILCLYVLCVWFTENISIPAAILITGGDKTEQSAEVFLPWSNTTCRLPSLPDERYEHVQSSKLICGGGYASKSCLKWNLQGGGWYKLPQKLSEKRWDSCAWDRGDQLVIMGGRRDAGWTSGAVSSNGTVTSSYIEMKYNIWWDYD